LIDTRHFVKLIDGIGLLEGSPYWKAADRNGMKTWFASFLNWMETSKNGLDEMDADNNHGAWFDAQRLSMALLIGDEKKATEIAKNALNRLDKQMNDDGLFPKELQRTISLHYSTFVMDAFFNIAQMATHTNVDVWNAVTPSGKSLKKAFEVLKPYLAKEKEWTGTQIKPFHFEDGYALLLEGTKHFKCNNCAVMVKTLAADKAPNLKELLLY
jgi:Alginate lyase